MSASSGMAPARRRGMADEVADRIREAIYTGGYPPGAALREVELATELEVSRGPVREALLRLEREGLVRQLWHRGTTVTTLSAKDAAEIDSLRAALERLAIEQLTEHATAHDLAEIDGIANRMTRAEDNHAMVRLDMEFHDAVYAAAHHGRLEIAWQGIRSQVYLFLLTRIDHADAGYLEDIATEHGALANALREGDAKRTTELFAEHRRNALDILLAKD